MAAPKGNRFWEQRAKHGRDLKFPTPDDLWAQCVEYFEWCESHPLFEQKAHVVQGVIEYSTLPKMRAMTLGGLHFFIRCDEKTWSNYRAREDFVGVIREVERIIYEQKFSGAAADLLNANIIARDLGLKDASSKELTGKDGGAINVASITAEMDPAEASRIYKAILSE